jgi:phytanoyl-CoA hydroxylase
MWLALDHVDQENGCMRYARGSHKHGMRPHASSGVLGFSQGMTDFGQPIDLANEVPVPAQPGDLLVHHALTIHRADGNRTVNRPRRSMGFIYFAKSACEDVVGKQAYQERLRKSLLAEGKI